MKFAIYFVSLIVLLAIYATTETRRFKVTRYTVRQPDIPISLSSRKLLLLSDLHCTEFGPHNEKLLKAISDSNADIIVIAGDLINGHSDKEFPYAEYFLKELSRLGKPIYYTFGNHELILQNHIGSNGFEKYVNTILKYCTLLNNSGTVVIPGVDSNDRAVELSGLLIPSECYHAKRKKISSILNVRECLGANDPGKYNILIAHDPTLYKYCFDWGADLILSGHLHGGMFRLPVIGGIVSPRYNLFPKPDKGLFNCKGRKIIVSGGLGWHSIPFRFLNLPEIVLISFEQGKSSVKEKTLH